MHYIVMDLEWNIGVKPTDNGFFEEIIEIGAVKLDRNFNVVGEFSSLVRPSVNKTLNSKVKSMTRIPLDELRNAKKFRTVYDEFLKWCGYGENVFLTWSQSDIIVFLNNLKFYRMPVRITAMDSYCDIQAYVQKRLNFEGSQMSLSAAAEQLGIDCESDELHRAVYDAIITARCFKDTYNGGLEEYIRPADDDFYGKIMFKNKSITRLDSDLFSMSDLMIKCPDCGRYLKRMECFKRRNKAFVSLYRCNPCGKEFRGRNKIRIEYEGLKIYKDVKEIDTRND